MTARNVTFFLVLFLMVLTIGHASRSRTYDYDTPTPPSYTYYYSYQDGPHYTTPSYTYQDKPYYTQPPPSPTYQDEPNYIQPPPAPTQQDEPKHIGPPPSPTHQDEPKHIEPPPAPTQQDEPKHIEPPPSPTHQDNPTPEKSYSGGGASGSNKAEFLQVHNQARADLGIPPLVWDDNVASYAQSWANQRINDCRLVHSNTDYGENIFWGSGKYSAAFATQSWVNERKDYDYNTNSCRNNKDCGHYTQIVWKKSTRLGCARVVCNNGGVFVTCNYDPPGNYVGQRPY